MLKIEERQRGEAKERQRTGSDCTQHIISIVILDEQLLPVVELEYNSPPQELNNKNSTEYINCEFMRHTFFSCLLFLSHNLTVKEITFEVI